MAVDVRFGVDRPFEEVTTLAARSYHVRSSPLAIADPNWLSDSPDLLALARTGDERALTVLYRRHAADLVVAISRLLGSHDTAEDTVQDLFVALPEALAGYTEQGQFGAWLRRAAVRLALTRRRVEARRQQILAGEARGASEASHATDRTLDRMSLEQAIARLPQSLRAVFVLKEVEGYSHAEIAGLLEITRAASEVRLFRAIRWLRAYLS
jgi:RNA polymerase sigma-70 factor (ECF subfamily)